MTALADTQRAFRDALGAFATGVTIATTLDGDGAPVGVTASSFNSVSLDPPLVLWSLAKSSLSRAAFCDSGHFAVHVLAASQEALSNRFARSGEDKFAEVAWSKGLLGSPVFDDHAALFQCKTRHQYDGGDHIIMVGEVVDFETCDVPPLLFHGGRYANWHTPASTAAPCAPDVEPHAIPRLIARAHQLLAQRQCEGTDPSLDAVLTGTDRADVQRLLGQIIAWLEADDTPPRQG